MNEIPYTLELGYVLLKNNLLLYKSKGWILAYCSSYLSHFKCSSTYFASPMSS